jgi:hypothetical protein
VCGGTRSGCVRTVFWCASTVRVVADDGTTREESFWILETSVSISRAMTWGVQYLFSPDAILLCSGRTIMIPGLDTRLPRVQGSQAMDGLLPAA